MDVSHVSRLSRYAASLLALGGFCRAGHADQGNHGADQGPSMLVVTATDAGEELRQPAAVAGTELLVRASDDEFEFASDSTSETGSADSPDAAATADVSDAEPTELSVAANSQQRPALTIISDEEVVPAAMRRPSPAAGRTRGGMFEQGPRRPQTNAGIRTRQQPMSRGQNVPTTRNVRLAPKSPKKAPMHAAASPQAAPHLGPVASEPAAPGASPAGAEELLVQAYELSLRAATEQDYSQIIAWCASAMRLGLQGENRQFGLNLSAWALNRRGQLRADQGQNAIALADFRAAVDFDDHCWRAIHNRGVTYAQSGQFAEAFDDVSRVIELNPKHAKAFSNRATLYVQAGELERALADYQNAIRLEPTLVPALVGHARVCHMMGRLDAAVTSFDAAIEQDDSSAEVICSRGDLLADMGRYGDALQDYARVIDLDPKFEHAYRNGAWLLATCPDPSIRDVEGALKGAQAALDCGYGERHAALDTLAAALANAGRFEEAVAAIQQAIEIAPEDARPAYQARQELYEARQPFRTQPLTGEILAVEPAATEPAQAADVQTAEFVEING